MEIPLPGGGNTVLAESLGRKYEKGKRKTGKIRNKKKKRKDKEKMGSISMKIKCKMVMKIKTKSVSGVTSMCQKRKNIPLFGGEGEGNLFRNKIQNHHIGSMDNLM